MTCVLLPPPLTCCSNVRRYVVCCSAACLTGVVTLRVVYHPLPHRRLDGRGTDAAGLRGGRLQRRAPGSLLDHVSGALSRRVPLARQSTVSINWREGLRQMDEVWSRHPSTHPLITISTVAINIKRGSNLRKHACQGLSLSITLTHGIPYDSVITLC